MQNQLAKIISLILCFAFLLISTHSRAADCTYAYQWSPNGQFLWGDYVRHKGLLYSAKRNVTTQKPDPANTSGPWKYLGVCSSAETATCDFNGDGKMDLATGLPYAHFVGALISPEATDDTYNDNYFSTGRENAGLVNMGEVQVNYGNTSSNIPPDQIWNQDGLGMFPYARKWSYFGANIKAGDFNKDNFCDLAISAPDFAYNKAAGEDGRGLVNVLYGSPNGLTITVLGENGRPINPFDAQRFDQDSPGVPGTAKNYDRFGRELESGDFNGDGYDDLVIGVPGKSFFPYLRPETAERRWVGYFTILYGSKVGIQTSSPRAAGYYQHLRGLNTFEIEEGDEYAAVMATADFDNDGYTDLVVAAPGEDNDSGKVSLIRGSRNGLDVLSKKDFSLKNFRPDLFRENNRFGTSLVAADVNSDGFIDLKVGHLAEEDGSIGIAFPVNTVLIYGSATGLIIND